MKLLTKRQAVRHLHRLKYHFNEEFVQFNTQVVNRTVKRTKTFKITCAICDDLMNAADAILLSLE